VALQCADFYDMSATHAGDCGSGPVDSKTFQDPICGRRGGGCAVGWIASAEWLSYDFSLLAAADVDVTIRLSSNRSGKTAGVEVDGTIVGNLEGPGIGWDILFED
jgi:hypothetical protein